jgi:hypothetical protein
MTDLTGRAASNKTCKVHHRGLHYRYDVLDLTGLYGYGNILPKPTCQSLPRHAGSDCT